MKNHNFVKPLFAVLLLLAPTIGRAQLAQSTFATGTDDWLSVILPYPTAVPPVISGVYVPGWDPDAGGSLVMSDPDGTSPTGQVEYWQAPAAYLGDKSAAYGGTLAFDIGNVGMGNPPFSQEDIILVGGGLILSTSLPTPPPGTLAHYDVTMSEAGWKYGGLSGRAATQAEFQAALANVTDLFIRAEYQFGPDTAYFDNVSLSAGASAAPLPVRTTFTLAPCTPNPFNPATAITLDVTQAAMFRVEIIDAAGRRVRSLCAATLEPGSHRLGWDGTDDRGLRVASGTYFCRAASAGVVRTQGLVLVK